MKLDIRWQVLLAVTGYVLVLALLSYQVQTAALCTETVPAAGGIFAEGVLGRPQFLNPLLADRFPVDRELNSLIFDGLTEYGPDGSLQPALARSWSVSEDGLRVTFELREGVRWHDGEPFSATDVVFTYGLLQDDDFPGRQALKTLWQSVTINQLDELSVEFVLSEPYAPFLEATTRAILPAHRLRSVTAANIVEADFNLAPVGTGPFRIATGQSWERTGFLRLVPDPGHWRVGSQIDQLEFRFFSDLESLVSALATGEIQAINRVPPAALPEVAALPNVRLFSAPAERYTMLLFNLSGTVADGLDTARERRALAYALDRPVLVDQTLNGQGLPLEGPYLPSSWAYEPEVLTLFSSAPLTATTLLQAEGWILPSGQTILQQAGQPLEVRLLALDTATNRALVQSIAGQWAAVGVAVVPQLIGDTGAWREALTAREFDVALVEISPTRDPDQYDFWSQEAIIRGQNFAGWNRRRASEALESARQQWEVEQRRPFYSDFLRLFDEDLPALTLFQHVDTYALSDSVNQAQIGRIDHPRDRYFTLPDWYLQFREVTVACETETG